MEKIKFHKYCSVIVIILTKYSLYCLYTSHSAYVATATESNGAKIDDF